MNKILSVSVLAITLLGLGFMPGLTQEAEARSSSLSVLIDTSDRSHHGDYDKICHLYIDSHLKVQISSVESGTLNINWDLPSCASNGAVIQIIDADADSLIYSRNVPASGSDIFTVNKSIKDTSYIIVKLNYKY